MKKKYGNPNKQGAFNLNRSSNSKIFLHKRPLRSTYINYCYCCRSAPRICYWYTSKKKSVFFFKVNYVCLCWNADNTSLNLGLFNSIRPIDKTWSLYIDSLRSLFKSCVPKKDYVVVVWYYKSFIAEMWSFSREHLVYCCLCFVISINLFVSSIYRFFTTNLTNSYQLSHWQSYHIFFFISEVPVL